MPDAPTMRESFSMTSGGQDRIAVKGYDAFVFAGFFGIHGALNVYGEHCTFDMRGRNGKYLVSKEVFHRVVADWRDKSLGMTMARAILDQTRRPVLVVERSRPSALLLDEATEAGGVAKLDAWRQAVRHGDAERLAHMYERQCRELEGEGVDIVYQRPSTIVGQLFTEPQFTVGSSRLIKDGLYGERDASHMNGAYGAIVLEDVLAALDRYPATPAG